ncbi:MAG: FAD-dependent oxidoreductase, partial [Thermotogaceae bacterium]|nr:FAD-dependent oxidoreductase [Thermotogaceae bacterium]
LEEFDVNVIIDSVVKVIENKKTTIISHDGVKEIEAGAVVFTTGARERPFGALMIPGDRPSGIFTAGVVQRFINIENRLPGKRALILGSGDIGLIMARRLTLEGIEVVGVVERMPYPGGLARNIRQCLEDFDIPLYLSSTVIEVRGKERLEEVVVAKVDETFKPIPGTEKVFKVDTLVLSAGLLPIVDLVDDFATLNETSRGLATSNIGQSSVEWLFGAGNSTVVYDLVDYVTVEGERAGKFAAIYAKGEKLSEKLPLIPGENIRVLHPRWYSKDDDLTIYVRVSKPMEKGKLTIGNYERTLMKLMPSEMVTLKIPARYLEGFEKLKLSIKEV